MKKMLGILVALTALTLSTSASAENITIKVARVAESPDSANYYIELLEESLKQAGHNPTIQVETLPQARVNTYLEQGKIDLNWLVESAQRNTDYVPVEIGITDSLIGKRVLLIRPAEQAKFDGVKTVEDFQGLGLTGGMGKNWFDVKVWKANGFAYKEQEGNWRSIYKMLSAGRTYDYFPRGMNEIVAEAAQNTDLAIEKNLILQYERDFRYYLSKNASSKKDIIQQAVQQAKDSGLMESLIKKYWANDFSSLDFDNRTIIQLTTPQ